MKHTNWAKGLVFLAFVCMLLAIGGLRSRGQGVGPPLSRIDAVISQNALAMLDDGRRIFRFDTFGDEAFWGDTLHLNQAIAGSQLGGVGPGVSPKTALAVGLKVDVDALPQSLVEALKTGKVNLDDPSVTLDLLRLDAVVGVNGFFDQAPSFLRLTNPLAKGSRLQSMGIQCALCHSTVDDSLAPGIGHRLDFIAYWPLMAGRWTPASGSAITRVWIVSCVIPANN